MGENALQPLHVARRADKDRRFGISDEIAQLAGGIAGVERQIDKAGTQAGQIEKNVLGALLHLHGDAVAFFGAMRRQHMGIAPRLIEGLRKCDRLTPRRRQENLVAAQGRHGKAGEEIIGHVACIGRLL